MQSNCIVSGSCILLGAILLMAPQIAFAQGDAAPPPPPGDATAAPPPAGGPGFKVEPAKQAEKSVDEDGDPKTRPAPNSIYVEGLGAGIWYSFNYERRVIDDLGVRAGFSYISYGAKVTSPNGGTTSAGVTLLNFPITASYLGIRSGKHALELGGGVTITHASGTVTSGSLGASGSGIGAFGNAIVGYRLHPVGRAGFNFRIGAMALVGRGFSLTNNDPTAFGVLPFGYMSMGASF